MLLTRLADWPERLSETIEAARGRPFSWGDHDCALFAADCALALTGVDPLAPVRGEYASERGAARTLLRLGCENVEQLADLTAGERVAISSARRGDWVLCPPIEPIALGVCLGAQSVFLEPAGLTFRPTINCAAAWRIGE